MGAWGKDLFYSLAFAEIIATIVWLIGGGGDTAQAVAILVVWPLALVGMRQARANGWLIRPLR